jgi:hypothetical protein
MRAYKATPLMPDSSTGLRIHLARLRARFMRGRLAGISSSSSSNVPNQPWTRVWIVHVPRVSVSVSDNIAVFEAAAIAAIAFVLAAVRSTRSGVTGNAIKKLCCGRSQDRNGARGVDATAAHHRASTTSALKRCANRARNSLRSASPNLRSAAVVLMIVMNVLHCSSVIPSPTCTGFMSRPM